jgi:hypothetical protein
MRTVLDYLSTDWRTVVIPFAVFAVSLIATFWFRKIALNGIERRLTKSGISYGELLVSDLEINALQRGSTIIVQKSLGEGFGPSARPSGKPNRW